MKNFLLLFLGIILCGLELSGQDGLRINVDTIFFKNKYIIKNMEDRYIYSSEIDKVLVISKINNPNVSPSFRQYQFDHLDVNGDTIFSFQKENVSWGKYLGEERYCISRHRNESTYMQLFKRNEEVKKEIELNINYQGGGDVILYSLCNFNWNYKYIILCGPLKRNFKTGLRGEIMLTILDFDFNVIYEEIWPYSFPILGIKFEFIDAYKMMLFNNLYSPEGYDKMMPECIEIDL